MSRQRGKGLLNAEQSGQLRGWTSDKVADQVKLPFALCTIRTVLDFFGAALQVARQIEAA